MKGGQNYSNIIQRSLSCLSPNGLTNHSLVGHVGTNGEKCDMKIVSHFLPIEKENTDSDSQTQEFKNDHEINSNRIKIVETPLPDRIVSLLKIDPAIELLCVDNNMSSTSPITSITAGEHQYRKRLPLLALYSSSSLWLISITFTSNESLQNKVTGKISFVLEPFEDALLTCHSSTRIIRVRAAPSSLHCGNNSNKFNMICPSGSMALLTSEGALILNHARSIQTDATSDAYFHKRKNGTRYGVNFESDSDDDNIYDTYGKKSANANKSISYYTTTPFSLGLGSDDTNVDPITDFCFGNSSNDFFTVYVLRKSGDVYAANPILFDGTAIPRHSLKQQLSQLDHYLETLQHQEQDSPSSNDTLSLSIVPKEPQDSLQDNQVKYLDDLPKLVRSSEYKEAQARRIKAEKQYLKDSFPDISVDFDHGKENSYYLTSHIHGGASSNATLWPVQLQGPLLFGKTTVKTNDKDAEVEFPCDPAMTIESLNVCISNNRSKEKRSNENAPVDLTYLVVGRLNGLVDICVLSRCLESRFGFESVEDMAILDSRIVGAGAVLETIYFSDDDENPNRHEKVGNSESKTPSLPFQSPSSVSPYHRRDKNCHRMLSLIVDSVLTPENDQLIHYISETEVFTISTSTVSNLLNKNTEKSTTTAWSCLTIGADSYMTGAVVSGEPSLGHILVATISTGSLEVVNLSAAQYLHQASFLPASLVDSSSDKKDETFDSIPLFTEAIAPIVEKIQRNFSSTGKLIGTQTYPKDAGPTHAAQVLAITQKLEEEIVLPMHQLFDQTEAHKKILVLLHQSLTTKLKTLKTMIDKAKQNHKSTISKFEAIEANASALTKKSAAILTASRSTQTKLSQAEYEYFNQLKRWEIQFNEWEGRLGKMQSKVSKIMQNHHESKESAESDFDGPKSLLNLSDEQLQLCGELLRGQGVMIKNCKNIVSNIEPDVKNIMKERGMIP